jgi:DDE family transposase
MRRKQTREKAGRPASTRRFARRIPTRRWRPTLATAITGIDIKTVTADDGYAYAKVYGALERRGIDALIPAKAEPIKSRVPLRRFRYDAKHDILKCPTGRVLRPTRAIKHGRFFYSKAKDCVQCPLKGGCLSKGRVNKAVVVGDDHPALLRARRRRERWSADDRRLYQRHRWRSEGFHGEAKTWHGLARAVRRGLANMKIQNYLTAAAVNQSGWLTLCLLLFCVAGVPSCSSDRTGAPASLGRQRQGRSLHSASLQRTSQRPHDAALPSRLGKELRGALAKPEAGIRGD